MFIANKKYSFEEPTYYPWKMAAFQNLLISEVMFERRRLIQNNKMYCTVPCENFSCL